MRQLIFAVLAILGGCAHARDSLAERPVEARYATAAAFDTYEACMRFSERRFGPMTAVREGSRRHLRFRDELLVTLSPAPEGLTQVEARTRDGYPPPVPGTVRVTTLRQLVESCL
ncbi:MAG TPA: hypothetical protein VF688_15095 [Allosphingosinicella sp.]|jgi:hypothetical protein